MSLPTPEKMISGYFSSDFHQKNFKQPLVSRSRQEDEETQKARKQLVEQYTPAELAKLSHPLDIPLPKIGKKSRSKSRERKKDGHEYVSYDLAYSINKAKLKFFFRNQNDAADQNMFIATLPRSLKEKNLITSVKENEDDKVLEERRNLVKTMSPAQLAQLNSITDFPVPSRITNIFSSDVKKSNRR